MARSEASAWRAEEKIVAACAKIEGADPSRHDWVTTNPKDLSDCDVVVEAIVEELDAQGRADQDALDEACPDADLATTTSSLGIGDIAGSRRPAASRAHVFNPVPRMALVEVCIPDGAEAPASGRWPGARRSARPRRGPRPGGFVVNRLLFPYLFDGVRLMERTGMEAARSTPA